MPAAQVIVLQIFQLQKLRKKLQKNSDSNFDASSWSNKPGRNWEYNSGKSKRGKGRKGRR